MRFNFQTYSDDSHKIRDKKLEKILSENSDSLSPFAHLLEGPKVDYKDDVGLERPSSPLESADFLRCKLIVTSILSEFHSAELPFSKDSKAQEMNERKTLRCPNQGHVQQLE